MFQSRPACVGEVRSTVALGRGGGEEAQRMLQRVGRGGEAGSRQPRRDDARVRRPSRMEGLRHGAEVGDQAGALRGAERDRLRRLVRIEAAQRGAGRSGGDGAEDARGVPALLVVLLGIAALQVGPHLVARDIGRGELRAGGAQRLALGQDGRHQHGARVAAQSHVVVVERVRGGAVDPGGLGGRHARAGQVEGGVARGRSQRLQQDARRVLDAARDQGADAVGKAGVHHGEGVGGDVGEAQGGHERAERTGQAFGRGFGHGARLLWAAADRCRSRLGLQGCRSKIPCRGGECDRICDGDGSIAQSA